MRHGSDFIIMSQRGVEAGGGFEQVLDHLGLLRPVHEAALHCHVRGERGQHGELTGKGLGRGDANLRTGVGRQQQVSFTCHRAGWHVDHHGDGLAVFLAVAQRRQSIGGFARLRDEQRETARLQHRIAVAKLGCEIDVGRQPCKLFKPVFGDHPCVVAGPAGDDGDAVDAGEIEIELRQRHGLIDLADIAAQRLRDHGGLLEDLFLHEVAIIALLDLRRRRARGGDLAGHRLVVLVEHLRTLAGHHHPIALVEIGDLLRQRGEREGI